MTIDIIIKYLHFLGILGVFSSIFYELIEIKSILPRAKVTTLAKIDGLYGLTTLIVLATGFTMWFWVGKPAEFYSDNLIFYTKIGIFTLVGLASIYPTVFFAKHKKGEPEDMVNIPAGVIILIRLEMVLILTLPLLATTMARGIGNNGILTY
ncbi:MAG: DUF2214 family protein [Cyclobacteriaceae bacterium]